VPWPAPTIVTELVSGLDDKGPGLSNDGLTLCFERNNDVWKSTRVDLQSSWSAPTLAADLSSADEDKVPSFYDDDLGVALVHVINQGDLVVASRASRADSFGPAIPLAELNTGLSDSGPELHGPRLYFDSNRAGGRWELYLATRDATGTYGPPVILSELGAPTGGDTDITLTADERLIVFQSSRSGNSELYEATR
jgi:hypothetical protein